MSIMRCWKCGQENTQGASQCVHCGISLERSAPTTETGAALRQLYDHYGAEALLTNPLLMVNGLGDLLQDSGKFRNQLKMAMEAGIGKIYLQQIQTVGKPNSDFTAKTQKVLVEDAELSEAAAKKITNAFDEMIGWNGSASVQKMGFKEISQSIEKKEIRREEVSKSEVSQSKEIRKEEISKPQEVRQEGKNPIPKEKSRLPLIILILLAVAVGVFLIINHGQKNTPASTITITEGQKKASTINQESTTTPTTEHRVEVERYDDGSIRKKTEYDENGIVVKVDEYSTYDHYTNYYDTNGNMIEQEWRDSNDLLKQIRKYNPDGSYSSIISYYSSAGRGKEIKSDGKTVISESYFDSVGKPLKSIGYNADGTIYDQDYYEYSSSGKRTYYKHYRGESLNWDSIYDENELCIKTTHYENGKIWFYELYTYDDSGNKISEMKYDANDTIEGGVEYSYNSAGQIVRENHYEKNHKLAFYYIYKYDANGNFISKDYHYNNE